MQNNRLLAAHCFFVFCVLGSFCFPLDGNAAVPDDNSWIRYPTLSPDGKEIALAFQGDIWIVSINGGAARQLTLNAGYERTPIWSPDGKRIVFAADWHGNFDLFIVSSEGGTPKRLTFHSTGGSPGRLDYHLPGDIPTAFTPLGNHILFSSRRHDNYQSRLGNDSFGELYLIPVDGGRPRQLMTTQADFANYDSLQKRIVFQDYKGYEDHFRKHRLSSSTRDVWTYKPATKEFSRLTGFAGDDLNPIWSPDGKHVYFLSEQLVATGPDETGKNIPKPIANSPLAPRLNSSHNVWRLDVDAPENQEKLTDHQTHPVRFLSVANDETLCYLFDGSVYAKPKNRPSRQINISFPESNPTEIKKLTFADNVSEFAVSPNDKKIAFVVRGEVFMLELESGMTTQLTNTTEQERDLTWSPESERIYFASERNGSWNIYETLVSDSQAAVHEVLATKDEAYGCVCSPDGKQIAFARNHHEIAVLDLTTKKIRTVVPASKRFADSIASPSYKWSPDSQWLTFSYLPYATGVTEVGVANVDSGEITNLTQSGYADGNASFFPDGSTVLYTSDRYGMRSHGGWGSQNNILAICLNQVAFDQWPKPLIETASSTPSTDLNSKDLSWRRRRVSPFSSSIRNYDVSNDGRFLLYSAQPDDRWGLWLHDFSSNESKRLMSLSGFAKIQIGGKGGLAFLLQNGKLFQLDLKAIGEGESAELDEIPISVEIHHDSTAERRYIFEHAWRSVQQRFYEPTLGGVDWPQLKQDYEPFLMSINNDYDFADLIGEMVGELNVSHMGCRYLPSFPDGDDTAGLGLLFDEEYPGDGLRVAEVIKRGPCHRADCRIRPGSIVTHINGQPLSPKINHWKLLNRKLSPKFELTIVDPATDESWQETIESIHISTENYWLYERWVDWCRAEVQRLSNGRLGYVHIQWMSDSDYRFVYSEALGRYAEQEALILDTRFNGGGWLNDDLATLLGGTVYGQLTTQGRPPGSMGSHPMKKWNRPLVLLQNECNYSDGHCVPWVFKTNGIGKLVGAPVPGTTTTVWEEQQLNKQLTVSYPQIGLIDRNGKFVENQQLQPDILVLNGPDDIAAGKDPQLQAAVAELLRQIEK